METIKKLEIAVKALDSKKAYDIKVIKVDDLTILGDYFVIATGSSSTQVKALADEVDEKMSENGIEPNHIEGKTSGWILLDYGDVVIHVLGRNEREFYSLEKIWQDGEEVDITDFISK
ncbi:MAG: ribosome silencing factor [Acutalibacteraceae bacterium]